MHSCVQRHIDNIVRLCNEGAPRIVVVAFTGEGKSFLMRHVREIRPDYHVYDDWETVNQNPCIMPLSHLFLFNLIHADTDYNTKDVLAWLAQGTIYVAGYTPAEKAHMFNLPLKAVYDGLGHEYTMRELERQRARNLWLELRNARSGHTIVFDELRYSVE